MPSTSHSTANADKERFFHYIKLNHPAISMGDRRNGAETVGGMEKGIK
jgi:hypothetical protein